MKKQILLLFGFLSIGNESKSHSVPTRSLSVMIAAAASAKAAYDLYYQKDSAQRVAELYAKIQPSIPLDLTSESQLREFAAILDDELSVEILQVHAWLNNTYNSMFLPWNWTVTQKEAFEAIDKVAKYMLYTKIHACNSNQEAIVALCKSLYTSLGQYPLITAAYDFKFHISSCKSNMNENNILISKVLVDAQNLLLSSLDYRLEHFQKQLDGFSRKSIKPRKK